MGLHRLRNRARADAGGNGRGMVKSGKPSCSRHRTSTSSTRCPAQSRTSRYQNKAVIYDLLFKAIGRDDDHDHAANPKRPSASGSA